MENCQILGEVAARWGERQTRVGELGQHPNYQPGIAISIDGNVSTFAFSKNNDTTALTRAGGWGPLVPIRYAGDDANGYSADDEPHLGPDHRTLYFSSDRSVPTHLPRSREQALRDFEHMESWGYFTDYTNIWSIPLTPWLNANSNDDGKANAGKSSHEASQDIREPPLLTSFCSNRRHSDLSRGGQTHPLHPFSF